MWTAGLALLRGANWKVLAGGVAVLAALFYVGWLKISVAGLERDVAKRDASIAELSSDLSTARNNVATAERVNAENLAEIGKLKTDVAAGQDAVVQAIAQADARQSQAVIIKREIQRVVQQSPAPCGISPSVLYVLSQLRARASAGSADSGQGAASVGDATK